MTTSSSEIDVVLAFHMQHAGCSEATARDRLNGLVQFFALCAVKPGVHVASEPVDSFWHDFLLFTHTYKDFCRRTVRGYIHHKPATSTPPSGYFDTLKEIQQRFPDYSARAWPTQERMDWSEGWYEAA